MGTSSKILIMALLPVMAMAAPVKKMSMSAVAPSSPFSFSSGFAKYYQYQTDEGKEAEQLSDITLTPVYQTSNMKATSIIVYSINDKDSTQNDLEDPLFSVSSIPKNISKIIKGRYFMSGSLGLSKPSREVKGQYGALGGGFGLMLDSDAIRTPGLSLTSSLSLLKAFQKSEKTTKDEPNVNMYSVNNNILSYNWKKLTTSVQFMFVNSLKYDEDISNVYLTTQEVSYAVTKNFSAVLGHANKAKTMDDESGEFNIRVLNNETSYFYVRLDISI